MAVADLSPSNELLGLLPRTELSNLLEQAQSIRLKAGAEVYRQDGPVDFVYFPTTCVLGLVVLTERRKLIETATVGNEGMVGLPAFLGVDFHPSKVVAQISGDTLRLTTSAFLHAARPGTVLDAVMRRYVLYRLRTAKQTGVCNTLHAAEARLCRWLLMTQDRTGQDEFRLTHQFVSDVLGLRRQTVSITAKALQRAGLVQYRRGRMHIVHRGGLEQATCECYQYARNLFRQTVRLESVQQKRRSVRTTG